MFFKQCIRKFIASGTLLFVWLLAAKASPHEATGAERITVAVPDGGGLVSLGVFSAEGQLVRTLRQLAPEADFAINTNGLALVWDRTNNEGDPVPADTYQVRGWFVPPTVAVSGLAVHFNDWIDGEGDLPLAEVLGAVPEDGEQFLLIGREAATGTPAAWKADEEGLAGKLRRFEGGGRLLFADENTAVFSKRGGSGILAFSLTDLQAEPVAVLQDQKIIAAALEGTRALLCTDQGKLIAINDLFKNPEEQAALKSPPGMTLLAPGGGGVFASDGTRLWMEKNGHFQEIPTGDRLTVLDLAAGPKGTLWVAGLLPDEGGHAFARQYSGTGELLRELNLLDAIPKGIFTPENSLGIFLLTQEDSSAPVQLQGLRPLKPEEANPEGPADWEVFIDRSIHPNPGDLAARGVPGFSGEGGPSTLEQAAPLQVAPNSLQDTTLKIKIRTVYGQEGAWIEDEQGLRLAEICDLENIQSTALSTTKTPGTFRALVMLPGGTLEYEISGLEQIVRLQAGEILLNGHPIQPPREALEPQEADKSRPATEGTKESCSPVAFPVKDPGKSAQFHSTSFRGNH